VEYDPNEVEIIRKHIQDIIEEVRQNNPVAPLHSAKLIWNELNQYACTLKYQ
jgi:hypothetical protein